MSVGIIMILITLIGGLTVLVWLCSSISTIAKEIILYPVLVFSITFSGLFILSPPLLRLYFHLYFIGTLSLGIISHFFIMKKIDKTTAKIDIYIYIYTLFQISVVLGKIDSKHSIYYLLFGIVFYLINIYCFYRFRKDKFLKIIIMPTIVSGLCNLPIVLVVYILSITNP